MPVDISIGDKSWRIDGVTAAIDNAERSRLSRGTYPYAYPSLGNWNDNWDNNKQAYVMADQNDDETTSVCDGR